MRRIDNTSKIMYIRKNRYKSILNIIEQAGPGFYIDYFLHHSNNFEDIDETITCECGTVDVYRVESGILYGDGGYIIFPFPIDNEAIGKMYYFEMA